VALPADARHSGWQDASEMTGVFVKNQRFDLPALLGDAKLAEKYAHGTVVLSRLCPVDYHRFHFPAAGGDGVQHLGRDEDDVPLLHLLAFKLDGVSACAPDDQGQLRLLMPVGRHVLIGGVERGPVTLDGEAGLAVPGIFFLLGQEPPVRRHHNFFLQSSRILQIQSFISEDKPVVLLYNITIRQKEQARNKKCFPALRKSSPC
jgi:hypothetical protein